ncbi:hypothetical protein Dimus_029288 [Dionaea muscipula]
MVDYIVDEHNIDIESEALKKVKDMIVASCDHASPNNLKEKWFLYDIVANGRNGIDVDKFDYIVHESRACGLDLTIHKLFSARADLHLTVYTHAKVKAIERMVVDALLEANDHLRIDSSVDDPAKYWKVLC